MTQSETTAAGPVGEEALTPATIIARARSTLHRLTKAVDAIDSSPSEEEQIVLSSELYEHTIAFAAVADLASHPTTGQETVATPRDGGVREALEAYWNGHGIDRHDAQHAFRAGYAAALSAPGSAGPGETPRRWKLVPADPTEEMQAAGWIDKEDVSPREIYWAMLAAIATPSPAQEPGTGDTGALADIAAERRRQVEVEGWSPSHDDTHEKGEIARAAATYAMAGAMQTTHLRDNFLGEWVYGKFSDVRSQWPGGWDWSWFKPTTPRRDLVKAGALIVSEIERLDRATPATTAETPGPADREGER